MKKLRSFARYVRHMPDRVAHPLRRARLRGQLALDQHLKSVLFICHGNICRSPYAAASFIEALPPAMRSHVRVHSAGLIGPGRPAPSEAQAVAGQRGVDLTSHKSAVVTQEMVTAADLIIVMEPAQRQALLRQLWVGAQIVVLGDLDPLPIGKRAIIDPFGQSEIVFEESYERIDRCIDTLLAALQIPMTHRRSGGQSNHQGQEFARRWVEQSERSRQ